MDVLLDLFTAMGVGCKVYSPSWKIAASKTTIKSARRSDWQP
jgi:hypothetical protein